MMIQTIQLHILFQWDQNYFLQSNILFTQYILTPVHPLNTSYDNNLFKHTLGGSMSTYPILLLHSHFHLSKKLYCNTIQTIHLHILFQWDQNYFLQSNILFTQYIRTPVHPLNTTYKIIYLSTLWVGLCPNIPFTPLQPFPLCKMLCHNMIQTIQLHILFQWDQNYFLQSNILFTQYILTPVHPLNTSYIIIYLNTLWVSLCPHTHFTPPWPFPPVQNVMSQHNSNYSTTHIISMWSKLFPSVKYTFHSIYSNTSPSTKHNL